ncbi:uncharacterized protein AAGF69_010558 [Amazona ochrocephala]
MGASRCCGWPIGARDGGAQPSQSMGGRGPATGGPCAPVRGLDRWLRTGRRGRCRVRWCPRVLRTVTHGTGSSGVLPAPARPLTREAGEGQDAPPRGARQPRSSCLGPRSAARAGPSQDRGSLAPRPALPAPASAGSCFASVRPGGGGEPPSSRRHPPGVRLLRRPGRLRPGAAGCAPPAAAILTGGPGSRGRSTGNGGQRGLSGCDRSAVAAVVLVRTPPNRAPDMLCAAVERRLKENVLRVLFLIKFLHKIDSSNALHKSEK